MPTPRHARPRRRNTAAALTIALLFSSVATPSRAADEAAAPSESSEVTRARAEFVEGSRLAKRAQWAEALAAFERSAQLKPHAITTYNVGSCQRAMGQYTRARATFQRAVAENEAGGGGQLSATLLADTRAFIAEIDRVLATVTLSLRPASATIAADGRPLEPIADPNGEPRLVAGTRAPGPPEAAPSERFTVLLDPGAHVFTLSRRGYADAVVNRTFAPGSSTAITLELDHLPATIRVASAPPGAIVTIDGVDVGAAPVEISRPAGSYRIVARRAGFVTYDTRVAAQAGERVELAATLPAERRTLTSEWWFWTGIGAVVIGAGATTYFATRTEPEPTRPPLSGGGLGWTVPVQ